MVSEFEELFFEIEGAGERTGTERRRCATFVPRLENDESAPNDDSRLLLPCRQSLVSASIATRGSHVCGCISARAAPEPQRIGARSFEPETPELALNSVAWSLRCTSPDGASGHPCASEDNRTRASTQPSFVLPSRSGSSGRRLRLPTIVLGLVSGFVASKIANKSGEGVVLDIVLGVVGAVVGGVVFNAVGARGVDGFNIWSLFVAVLGAMVVLAIKHALTGRRRLHA